MLNKKGKYKYIYKNCININNLKSFFQTLFNTFQILIFKKIIMDFVCIEYLFFLLLNVLGSLFETKRNNPLIMRKIFNF